MDKEKNIKRAKEIFADHSTKDVVHFSADGSAFFNESDRNNHTKTLKDKAIHTVKREDVMPSKPGEDDEADFDEDDDKLTREDLDEQAIANREKLDIHYKEVLGTDPDPDKTDAQLEKEIADKQKADKKAVEDQKKAEKKAADDKAKADKKAAAEKDKADKKAAAEKDKADKKAAPETK